MYNNIVHRTQILLEERQYAALKALARRGGRSLSEIIRTAVDEMLGERAPTHRKGLARICAIAGDPGGPSGKDHDALLYGGLK